MRDRPPADDARRRAGGSPPVGQVEWKKEKWSTCRGARPGRLLRRRTVQSVPSQRPPTA